MIKAGLITIGNEILLGKTINTNLSFIGQELSKIGINLFKSITVKDDSDSIKKALSLFWEEMDIVFTTGGLGPTIDDITKKNIAIFFGKEMLFSDEIWREVQNRFGRRNLKTPMINRSQAEIPADFVALNNAFGTAPGLYFKSESKKFFALPGVPIEMKHLFCDEILPILKSQYKLKPIISESIHTINISESLLAEKLSGIKIPENVELAFLPQTGRVDLRIYGSNTCGIKDLEEKIVKKISPYIWAFNKKNISEVLHEKFLESSLSIGFAESCTGGLLGQMITQHSGASSYFKGSIVSYSNEAKVNILGVKQETLDKFGAVSSQTASEMARGVAQCLNVDIAGSITGIAGPDGGTQEKPIGTVFIGIFFQDSVKVRRLQLSGDRESIRIKSAEQLLNEICNLGKK